MSKHIRLLPLLAALAAAAAPSGAMRIRWIRMTGQWPVETAPLVTALDGKGQPEILALNRIGQLMAWSTDGASLGAGQDGTVAQLPDRRWTTTPTLVRAPGGARIVACCNEGLVICLDRGFHELWRHQLPGTTMWARANPAILRSNSDSRGSADGSGFDNAVCFGDELGTVTCLDLDGGVLWSVKPGNGPCRAPLRAIRGADGENEILAACGADLCCLDHAGKVLWRTNLGGNILSRPEVLELHGHQLILCGAGGGALLGLSSGGKILWKAPVGDEIDTSIAFLPRPGKAPLILCMGLWGSLNAIDPNGHLVWSHFHRSKARCIPLVFNAGGKVRIAVPFYGQHLCLFDADGNIVDDLRLSGGAGTSPILLPCRAGRAPDLLVITSTLTALRISSEAPVAQYGGSGRPTALAVRLIGPRSADAPPSLVVANPRGALVSVNVSSSGSAGASPRRIQGCMTERSALEMPLVAGLRSARAVRALVRDPDGRVLIDQRLAVPPAPRAPSMHPAMAWAETPYADFNPRRQRPMADHPAAVTIDTLYRGEVGAGAFLIAPRSGKETAPHVRLERLKRNDGVPFGGTISLRRVVTVGTINGEEAADALPLLTADGKTNGGVFAAHVAVPASEAAKIWLSVDSHGAAPGRYRGRILVSAGATSVALPVQVEVLPLAMPKHFPLRFCTWDYVPNKWFPKRAADVLDDMVRHGVSVFPRSSCIPKADADADGKLTFDWAALDTDLALLKGRGRVLLQLLEPPITYSPALAAERRANVRIAYVRAFRDHLREQGWGYADYAFYPVDEPGLDLGKSLSLLVDAATMIHAADPKLRVYTDPVPTLAYRDFLKIEPLLDVWSPNMHLVSGLLTGDPRMRRIKASGKPVWSYECVSQVKSLSPLCYNRGNPWRASFFGLQGIGFWTHSTVTADPWKANAGENDEYALVYPGETPVPSVRWEAVRQGMQDVAAIVMLQSRMDALRGNRRAKSLVAEGKECLRIARADVMEISDPAFVQSRDYLRKGDRRIWHTPTDEATYCRHRSHIARLTLALNAIGQTRR